MSTTFNLLREHVTLLQNAYIGWQDCETGAPEIDPKRPYGNSDVDSDVCRTLGWQPEGDDGERACYSSRQRQRARELHAGTETALQLLCLFAGQTLEPGLYEQTDKYMRRSWRKIGPPTPEAP